MELLGFLKILGQYVDYIKVQLEKFCFGICVNDMNEMMCDVVYKLIDVDIDILFKYVGGLYQLDKMSKDD